MKDELDFWKGISTVFRSEGLSTDKCPECKSDLEFRGREKATKKFWYYRYELFCPECGEITYFEEGKRRTYVDLSRMRGRHAGEIGEKFAREILVKAGYEIRSFMELASDALCKDENGVLLRAPERLIGRGRAKLFLGEKFRDFIDFCEMWNKDVDVGTKIRSIGGGQDDKRLFSIHGAGFDWVGKKGGKLYLIEVKTNRAVLMNYQKKMLIRGKDFGFVPVVLRVKVEIAVPREGIKWKFI